MPSTVSLGAQQPYGRKGSRSRMKKRLGLPGRRNDDTRVEPEHAGRTIGANGLRS